MLRRQADTMTRPSSVPASGACVLAEYSHGRSEPCASRRSIPRGSAQVRATAETFGWDAAEH